MYEKRVLAFIDVLGFEEAVNKTMDREEENEFETNKIKELLEEMSLKIKDTFKLDDNGTINQFSDSIIISYPMKDDSKIVKIIINIMFLCSNILNKGHFLRGAIVCDNLYHKDNIVFGPALIKACKMEKKLALYPRIILDENIISLTKNQHSKKENELIKKITLKDFDGLYYINIFNSINYIVGKKDGILVYFNSLRNNIIELGKQKEKANNKSKYLWLKEKYNKCLNRYKRKYVNNEKEKEEPELYKYISKLTLI